MASKAKKKIPKKAKKRAVRGIGVQYVLPLGNGWVVKNSLKGRFITITDKKWEAVSIARSIARTKGIELIVHNKDGRIGERISYAQ